MATDELNGRKAAPKRIGRYELTAKIGRGAMGVVYQARDEVMRRDVALKVLTADFEDDPEIRTRFLREAQAAAGLSHPNVITIFDVGEENDRFFIVMELLRGMVLKSFLKQPESARLGRKIHLMMQLCAGLGAAHHASIYHRDIKPGNVFVRSDGLLKIVDFGVARFASSNMTASGFVVGTPDYMSPEQARGEEIDGRSDIFSAGAVFYYMLTGRKPFAATALPTLFHQIQSEDPPPIDGDVPAELSAVVMKALSKNRDTRYRDCAELLADLKLVTHLYPLEAMDTAAMNLTPDPLVARGAGGNESGQSSDSSSVAAAAPSTDDTQDLEPRGAADATDDTVSLETPRWGARIKAGLDAALAGVAARWTRSSTPAPTGHSSTRKR
ncbi:MAG TPA: serine/threonine-protein kinase [Vicinamibacterales bacterium]|jgi:serine/threonine-protein kinase|nr:serine/threonine-protein kinase [Vicinamibacterales bacterium]